MTSDLPLYEPLDMTRREVRLVRLAPYQAGGESHQCECELTTVSLIDSNVCYNAVSYVWGDSTPTELIKINGRDVKIAKNLHSFMRQYREIIFTLRDWPVSAMPLWIDSLCINQDDVDEKNEQVQMMSAIYRGSNLTVAWLGYGDADVEFGMRTISGLVDAIRKAPRDDPTAWINPEQTEIWTVDANPNPAVGDRVNRFWWAFESLMSNAYWTRAWILQEIVLPENCALLHGKTMCSLLKLLSFSKAISRLADQPRPPFIEQKLWYAVATPNGQVSLATQALQSLFEVYGLQKTTLGPEVVADMSDDEVVSSWRQLAITCVDLYATDPRDKLYSLLGLLHGRIRPNYFLSVEDIYADFAQRVGEAESGLGFLRFAGHFGGRLREERVHCLFVPSWAPNWDKLPAASNFKWTLGRNHADLRWEDCLNEAGNGWQRPFSFEGRKLRLRGVVHSRVATSHICELEDGSWVRFCEWYKAQVQDGLYVTGIPVMQALARLLFKDRTVIERTQLSALPDEDTLVPDPGGLAMRDLAMAFIFTIRTCAMLELKGQATDNRRAMVDARVAQINEALGIATGVHQLEAFFLPHVYQQVKEHLARDAYIEEVSTLGKESPKNMSAISILLNITLGMQDHVAITTTTGHIGWARPGVVDGDLVAVIFGCDTPLILRKVDDEHHIVIGPCFVLGLMNGEAINVAKAGKRGVEAFCVV